MGIKQLIRPFKGKKFDEGIRLRSYPKWGIYEDKEKGWGKLFEEISAIVEFYMFIYRIEAKVDAIDHGNSVSFQFIELHHRNFIVALEKELERVFNRKVVGFVYKRGGSFIRVYLNSERSKFGFVPK